MPDDSLWIRPDQQRVVRAIARALEETVGCALADR
jgi:hypothetical protein